MSKTALPRVAAAALIALAAITLSGCSAITGLINGPDDVFALAVGDCINDYEAGDEVTSVPVVDCDKLHDSEVYSATDMDDDSFPGLSDVQAQSEEYCVGEFDDFVGTAYEESTLYVSTLYPSEQTWAVGDREIVCIISKYDASGTTIEQVTGSLEDSQL